MITNLAEFQEAFPNHSYLESSNGCTRYSNGEEENSDHESEWFNDDTEQLVTSPEL